LTGDRPQNCEAQSHKCGAQPSKREAQPQDLIW